ncbi:hypothetical protein [Micromonospora kangleipakensis]|nr:hypothetical protein [Micromonospora kangleipakensis]
MVEAESYQPPTDVEVTSVGRDGDKAVAKVANTLAGQKLTAELPSRREESAALGLFHRWSIAVAPAPLSLPGGQAG